MDLTINPFDLTLEEGEEFEAYTGQSITAFKANVTPSAKVVTALIWLLKRREQPAFTLAQARQLRYSEVEVVLGSLPFAAAAPGDGSASSPSSATSTG